MTDTTKPAYSYDPGAGVFTGETVADLDPLVEGNWLYPANSTSVAPPAAPSGQIQMFDATAGTWSLTASWLATQLYLTGTGEAYVLGAVIGSESFSGLGALPAWLTSIARPSSEYVWTNGAWVIDPSLQNEAQVQTAQAKCAQLMAQASLITSGLSDAFIAGILSAADQSRYKEWAAYKLALTQIAQQSGYPANINWPAQPQ